MLEGGKCDKEASLRVKKVRIRWRKGSLGGLSIRKGIWNSERPEGTEHVPEMASD